MLATGKMFVKPRGGGEGDRRDGAGTGMTVPGEAWEGPPSGLPWVILAASPAAR